jgi:RNA polymerase sigma factor (sigma-70 family)
MATATLGTLLRHLHRLAAGRPLSAPGDHQLLEDFTARRDEGAFAALVARHGPMVLRVCRRVLHHEQDAEDAFQATFLVLARHIGSIRKREALAGWLYGVAYRTAMEAKRRAARRRNHESRLRAQAPRTVSSPTWDDVQAVLDEEVRRLPEAFRSAFVLCVLEGKSGPEAAAELGVKEGTVASRLARARCRLRERLARRGIQLAAVLAALSVAESSGAAVPVNLAAAAVRWGLWAVSGGSAAGPVPSQVAALAAGVTRAMFSTKSTVAVVLTLAAAVWAGAALWAQQVLPPRTADKPPLPAPQAKTPAAPAGTKAPESCAYRGRVLGPDGKPLAGAKLYLVLPPVTSKGPPVRATTGSDGRFDFTVARKELVPADIHAEIDVFAHAQVVAVAPGCGPDWTPADRPPAGEITLRLPANDVTIDGRILDLQGKPVAGAKVRVLRLETTADDDLAPFLDTWRSGNDGHLALGRLSKTLANPSAAGLPTTLTADADGRFRLPGAGRERIVVLSIDAPQIEHATLRVLPRPPAEVKALVRPPSESMMRRGTLPPPLLYGLRFDHLGMPVRPITGVVRDKETGKPLSGIRVAGSAADGSGETQVEAWTDREGRYQLRGLAKAGKYRLFAWPGDFSTYIPGGREVSAGEGLAAAEGDFELVRGVEVRGRVTDKVTGKPLAAGVTYVPLRGNNHPGAAFFRICSKNCEGWRIGTFREMVPPGPGAFLVRVRASGGDNPYPQAPFDPAGEPKTGLNQFELHGVNAYRVLDVPEKAPSLTCDIQIDPGRSVSGTVLGPDGKPLAGALVKGLTAVWPKPTPLKTPAFTVVALEARESRQLLFVHLGRKLAGARVVGPDDKGGVTVTLEPWGALTGRVLDEDGRPLAGARINLSFPHPMFFEPVTWWVPPLGEVVKTDREGRFRGEGLTPGLTFRLSAARDTSFLPLAGTPDGMRTLSVRPGQTLDLGDLQVKRD